MRKSCLEKVAMVKRDCTTLGVFDASKQEGEAKYFEAIRS